VTADGDVRTAGLATGGGRAVTRPLVVASGLLAVAGLALGVAAGNLAGPSSAGHAVYHASQLLATALLGGIIGWRRGHGRGSLLAVIGLLLFAGSQLVEGVGALGFDEDGGRTGLAVLHDIGIGLTPPAMLAAIAGLAIAIGSLIANRFPSRPLLAVAVAVLLATVGGFLVLKLIGM
jgi:hypothetical protein